MKIGLLAFHSACNFGATLQLYSTCLYLQNNGHEPVVINWIAPDLEAYYQRSVPPAQLQEQQAVRRRLWSETPLCRTAADVARVIASCAIEAVIIGSDAVAQHHPWLERLIFPTRTLFSVGDTMSCTQYPNPFWATWLPLLSHPVPVAALSVANQDSSFRLIPPSTLRAMAACARRYSYLSVRDDWTQQMFSHLSRGQLVPPVTPDPVFGLTHNMGALLPTAGDVCRRFGLPPRYVLLSFLPSDRPSVSQEWIDRFARLADAEGLTCVMLPFATDNSFGQLPHTLTLPLDPVDWFALIVHSQGYVGNNMHPIVVSLANGVPFFSFDTYGTRHLNGLYVSQSSSKIRHILRAAGFDHHRVSCTSRRFTPPTAEAVFSLLQAFDGARCRAFAQRYLQRYQQMMTDILHSFQ